MKEKRDCKIIQDLLPSYIEKLTNEETNKYIEEHLKECDECKKVLENMKEDLKFDDEKRDDKEVKYIKKFRNKMRILKFILLCIFIIFIVLFVRKIVILSKLSDNAEKFVSQKNYHRVAYSYDRDSYAKTEIFSMMDKKKVILTQVIGEEIIRKTMFATKIEGDENSSDRYKVNTYIESGAEKKAELDLERLIYVDPQNTLYTENLGELLKYSLFASVKETTFYGKKCYFITNFNGLYSYEPEGMYIDADTGLIISTVAYEIDDAYGNQVRWPSADYIYEFNTVTEDDFIEPDISEYTIIEED